MNVLNDPDTARYAALIALLTGIHAPQYGLTGAQWDAAEAEFDRLNDTSTTSPEDEVLLLAFGVMLDQTDRPDLSSHQLAVAEKMLARFTIRIDATFAGPPK